MELRKAMSRVQRSTVTAKKCAEKKCTGGKDLKHFFNPSNTSLTDSEREIEECIRKKCKRHYNTIINNMEKVFILTGKNTEDIQEMIKLVRANLKNKNGSFEEFHKYMSDLAILMVESTLAV